jgi:very-short-patch-repair endonuclease
MQLIEWPFRAAEALDAGTLTFRELRRFYRAVHPGVWVPRGVDLTHAQRASSAWLWSGRNGVVSGLTASAMLGAKWVEPDMPVELIHANRRPPTGILIHGASIGTAEVRTVGGLPVTTPARTAFDLGRRLTLTDGVQRIDALMNATKVGVDDVEQVIACHPGVSGLRRLRQTLALVDGGAESPYESLTRLLLLQNGFPAPKTQVVVLDRYGFVFARIDMGWPEYKVGVDFEGAHHWTDPKQRSWDVDRFAGLPELGWTDVRLTSSILHRRPRTFLDRVGAALIARGCPRTW